MDLPVEAVDELFGGAASEVRDPDIEWSEGGVGGKARASAGAGPLTIAAAASSRQLLGMRTDHRTGRRTLYFKLDGSASASLGAKLLGGAVDGSGQATLSMTFDRAGRPVELAAAANASGQALARAHVALRELVTRSIGDDLPAPGARVEVTGRLDLRAPANVEAAQRLVRAFEHGDPGGVLGAIEGLGERLVEGSRLAARLYETSGHTLSARGSARAGPGVAGSVLHRADGARLVHAWERPAQRRLGRARRLPHRGAEAGRVMSERAEDRRGGRAEIGAVVKLDPADPLDPLEAAPAGGDEADAGRRGRG